MCLVCGKDFLGNKAAFTCGTACRTYMSRDLKNGKKPEFWLVAKGKGQKMPDWDKKTKSIEPKKEEPKEVKVEIAELPKVEPEIKLTKEQIISKISELERKKFTVRGETCPKDKHPKMWALLKDDKVAEIDAEITQLQSKLK